MANTTRANPQSTPSSGCGPCTDTGGRLSLHDGDALLIIDLQHDFLPGGSLPVPQGDAVISPLNLYIDKFRTRGLPMIATRDWHPVNHCSFRERGGRWPPHCVRDTPGAEFAAGLCLPADTWVIDKATDPDREALSAFAVAGFDREMRGRGIRRLFVGGLATDYCVHDTVLDALQHGYQVVVLLDAIRPVDVQTGDGTRAIREMSEAGAELMCAEHSIR